MKIWVDADACPVVIRDILCKAAIRTRVVTTFVANHALPLPKSPYVIALQVSSGFDVADNEIVGRIAENDLLITSDIPLASEVIAKNAHVLSPRGEIFTMDNIKSRLNMRDFMETLRASGVQTSGPPALTQHDRKNFADQLDRLLTRHKASG